MTTKGRTNQKHRTRSALVAAAVDLIGRGKSPSITEVAEEARVSPATAYRYFPSAHSLWRAVLLGWAGYPNAQDVFEGVDFQDAEGRVAAMIRKTGWHMFDHEDLWRTAARVLLERSASPRTPEDDERIPVPTGRRMEWIRAALTPLQPQLSPEIYRRLCMGLALVTGTEAVITLRVVGVSSASTRANRPACGPAKPWCGPRPLAEQRQLDARAARGTPKTPDSRRAEGRTRVARSR